MIETTEAVTSGPMPSPGSSVILWRAIKHSVHPPARGLEGELQWKETSEVGEFRQFAKTALQTLDRGRNKLQIVKSSALDWLPRVRADDLDGALQESFEISQTEHAVRAALAGVVSQQLHFGFFAQEAGNTAVAEKRGYIVGIRTHSHILIVYNNKVTVYYMYILSMIIAMAYSVRMPFQLIGEAAKERNQPSGLRA